MGRLASMVLKMIRLFLDLAAISSSLATLIELGIPEMSGIQNTYATATFIIIIITYINYYTAIDTLRTETANIKTPQKSVCYETINHVTFWIKLLFGSLVLIDLNIIIWDKHYEEGFQYAGVSLITTSLGAIFSIGKYVLLSQFCQHKPLSDLILERYWKTHCEPKLLRLKNFCCCKKDNQ